nr:uncharacterized protein LOC127318530 [Lolium perenne]
MWTPRRCLQEDHGTRASPPPDPRILGFHPEHVEGQGEASTTPSRRERRPRTSPSWPGWARVYPQRTLPAFYPAHQPPERSIHCHRTQLAGHHVAPATMVSGQLQSHWHARQPKWLPPTRAAAPEPNSEHGKLLRTEDTIARAADADQGLRAAVAPPPTHWKEHPLPDRPPNRPRGGRSTQIWAEMDGLEGPGPLLGPNRGGHTRSGSAQPTKCRSPPWSAGRAPLPTTPCRAGPPPDVTAHHQAAAHRARAARRRPLRGATAASTHRTRSHHAVAKPRRRTPCQHGALAGRASPRRRHRTRGERGPAGAGAARASPGDALRRRRGGGEGEEGDEGRAAGSPRPPAGAAKGLATDVWV